MPAQKINIGAAPNDKTGDSLREAFALTNAAIDQVNANTDAIAGKVDKAPGMGLSQNSFTDAEQEKLEGLEGTHWRGTFTSLAALQTAIPAANAGDYADVDTGVGADVERYIWDVSDAKWVPGGGGTSLTAAQVKALYESNPDTNAFSDAFEAKLAGIETGAQVNVATNLAVGTRTATQVPITSSTGSTATLPAASASLAGVMPAADKAKLDGIAAGAQANVATDLSVAARTSTEMTVASSTGNSVALPSASATQAGLLSAADKAKIDAASSGVAYPDLIINGDMSISWRGTSWAGVTASNSAYFLDRWTLIQAASSAVATIAQVADVAFGENTQTLRYTVTTADASTTAGHVVTLVQKIEGFRIAKLISKPFTFRFKVRSPKTGKHSIAFKNSGGDRSYIAEYTVSQANTSEEKVITVPGLPTGGTWNFDTGMGLAVGYTLKCGATYQATAGAWQTGDFWGASGTANVCDTVGNIFAITDVHLHEGDATATYIRRQKDEEQRMCARYLPILFSNLQSYGSVVAHGAAVGTGLAIVIAKLGTVARTKPTGVTLQGAATVSASQGNPVNLTSITVDQASSVDVVTFQANVSSGLVAGQATYCITTGNILLTGCEL